MNNDQINKFIERAKSAQRTRSKELRITTEEAFELITCISELLLRENKLLNEIKQLQNNNMNIELSIDGGSLK